MRETALVERNIDEHGFLVLAPRTDRSNLDAVNTAAVIVVSVLSLIDPRKAALAVAC